MNIYIKLILVTFFWGGTFITTKIAGDSFEPFFGGFLRFSIALLVLIPLVYFKEGIPKLPLHKWIGLAIMSFLGIFLYHFFFFVGLQRVPPSRASLIVALNPIMVMIPSILFLGEKATLLRVLGILLSLLGAGIVISNGDLLHIAQQFQLGDLIMLGCPAAWAIYTLLGKRYFEGISPMTSTAICITFGWAMLGIASLTGSTSVSNVPMKAWFSLVYLAIFGTIIGYIWYSEGIQKIGATRTAIFNNLIPVFSILLSVIFLKENIPVSALMGGSLVILGVILTNR